MLTPEGMHIVEKPTRRTSTWTPTNAQKQLAYECPQTHKVHEPMNSWNHELLKMRQKPKAQSLQAQRPQVCGAHEHAKPERSQRHESMKPSHKMKAWRTYKRANNKRWKHTQATITQNYTNGCKHTKALHKNKHIGLLQRQSIKGAQEGLSNIRHK